MDIRQHTLRMRPLCVHCERQGRTTVAVEVDHITPLAHGGTDDDTNLQGLCKPCHDAKSESEAKRRARG